MPNSPFKFLDAYQKDDAAAFFGREQETAQLYNAVFASQLTLLYGASGTGKTSLVNCGLSNKFYETDWLPLFIRRGNDINAALQQALQQALRTALPDVEVPSVREQVQRLYLDYYKSIYLIFDQFEELLISGSQAEQELFYKTIRDLLQGSDPSGMGGQVKILIIIREEWIAVLNEFEKVVPMLFNNRLRVEKMNDRKLYRVILGVCQAHGIALELPKNTIPFIIKNLSDRREGVELTHLQVYLDRLYRKYQELHGGTRNAAVAFNPDLVENVGRIENVLSLFLDEQFARLEEALAKKGVKNPKGIPLDVLFALVTEDRTKKVTSVEEVLKALPQNRNLSESEVAYILEEFEDLKLLRQLE